MDDICWNFPLLNLTFDCHLLDLSMVLKLTLKVNHLPFSSHYPLPGFESHAHSEAATAALHETVISRHHVTSGWTCWMSLRVSHQSQGSRVPKNFAENESNCFYKLSCIKTKVMTSHAVERD